jgi:hypothetical protein
MKKIQLKRFMDLYNLLGDFPIGVTFGMDIWVEDYSVTDKKSALECGTACCAAGAAVLFLPSWNKEFCIENSSICKTGVNHPYPIAGYTIYQLSLFLGISNNQSECIFMPNSYKCKGNITKKMVQSHMKKVLNDNGYDIV